MRRSPPKSTLDDIPRPVLPAPNGTKSSAPAVVVQCWCGLVARMVRRTLDRFTRDVWARFDERELELLKYCTEGRQRGTSRPAGMINAPGAARLALFRLGYAQPVQDHRL